MRKNVFVCVFLAVVLFLLSVLTVGCAKNSAPDTSPEYNFATDQQYQNGCYSGAGNVLAETEDSLYYIDATFYIHVIDKNTMQDMVLCARPNCLHGQDDLGQTEQEKSECIAYTNMTAQMDLAYYDGAIYNVQSNPDLLTPDAPLQLIRIELDGSSKKTVWEIDWNDEIYGSVGGWVLHRGCIYFEVSTYDSDPKTGVAKFLGDKVYSYNLKTKKVKKIYDGTDSFYTFYALGDHLYLLWLDEEASNRSLIQVCISTGAVKRLGNCRWILPVNNIALLWYSVERNETAGEDTLQQSCMISDLDGSNERPYFDTVVGTNPKITKQIQTDGKSFFVTDGFDVLGENGPKEVRVYDYSTGELTATLPFPEEFLFDGARLLWVTQEGQLLLYSASNYFVASDEYPQFFYCNISDIGTENFQWHEVKPVN